MSSPAYIFKFIIVGNSAVGKSCLLLRFDEDRFQPIHDVTVGVTFSIKMVRIEGQDVKVQIWDTAGQEIFRSITRSYYRDSACAIIVFDITDQTSFDKIEDWIKDVRNLAPSDCLLVLVGNKLDLASQRVITTQQAQELADKHNIMYYETSAQSGDNVQQLFNESVSAVYQKAQSNQTSGSSQKIEIQQNKKPESGGCNC